MNITLNEIFYFMGITQSDGGFMVFVRGRKPVLKPLYKVTSKTNTNTLPEFRDFLTRMGVYSGTDEGVPSNSATRERGRGPSIRIQSLNSILKIRSVYRRAWYDVTGVNTPLLANKQRDFVLTLLMCSNRTLSKAEKMDLRHTLHKEKYTDPDLPSNVQTKSRAEHEEILNIVGKSAGAAKNIVESVENTLKPADPTKIPCDFWLGLLDGDGGFHVGCRPRYNDSRTYISYLEFSIYVTLTLELSSKSVFRDFEKAVGLRPSRIRDFRDTSGQNAYQIQIRDANEVKKLIKFIDGCGGLRGDVRKADYELMKETQNLREQGLLKKSFRGNRAYQHEVMDKLLKKILQGREDRIVDVNAH